MSTLTRQRVFPTGARIEISPDHQVRFVHGGQEYDQEPWLYEEVLYALSYDQRGELVVVVARLTRWIKQELGHITFVGARLYSSLLGGN